MIKITNGITRHPDWRMAEPINLEILQGEQIAIAGDNAAGKSRLIEILTGHFPLLMNEVKYDFSPSPLKMVAKLYATPFMGAEGNSLGFHQVSIYM